MTSANVCQFHKFGFCKFRKNCFRKHEGRKCDNDSCSVWDCELRHPESCRYFLKFGKCKFGEYCKFNHELNAKKEYLEEIDNLKTQLEILQKKIEETEKEISEKDQEIHKIRNRMSERFSQLENVEAKCLFENENKPIGKPIQNNSGGKSVSERFSR